MLNAINKIYDKDFRTKLIDNPKKYYREFTQIPDNIEIVVHKNSKDVIYLTMPSADVLDQSGLAGVQAGAGPGSASCVGSVGTASTLASGTSTASTAGCASSLGTAGCVA